MMGNATRERLLEDAMKAAYGWQLEVEVQNSVIDNLMRDNMALEGELASLRFRFHLVAFVIWCAMLVLIALGLFA